MYSILTHCTIINAMHQREWKKSRKGSAKESWFTYVGSKKKSNKRKDNGKLGLLGFVKKEKESLNVVFWGIYKEVMILNWSPLKENALIYSG